MPTIETSVHIDQPPEIVAQAFMDPSNAPLWTTDLERFEVISREPGEIGSVAHLHYRQGGRSYVMEDVLEEMIPNQYFKSRVSGNGIVASVETWLQMVDGGTEVRIRWSGSGASLPMRIILTFMKGNIKRQTKLELEKFKALVEAHGAHF
jgi:hypothetical protein